MIRLSRLPRGIVSALTLLSLALAQVSPASGGQNSYVDATRPTVSSDAAIQQKGVLQIEAGYDGFFSPYDQTQALSFYYALTNWLRLDAAAPGFRSTLVGVDERTTGLGNAGIGAKLIIFHQGKSRVIPGFAVQYAETFASASKADLRSRRHQGTLIMAQRYGNWRVKLNGTLIGDCYHPSGCGLRGQGVFGVAYKATDKLSLASDVFGQTVSLDGPPGAYGLFGATYKLRKDLALDGGVRFGLNDSASRIGFTCGMTFSVGGDPATAAQ